MTKKRKTVKAMKPVKMWALIWPDGRMEKSLHATRRRARDVRRLFPADTAPRIGRVEIREVKL